ncbi:sugar kinase [Saccharopolyspora phatthalungensis]|uniref:2-dehydro-3-deoxygluconokinase n=1 Tax=Saccharopolyspora phatthalungensis TaxID=664693 RepID=A0A840Q4T5_9PSEU|nr:sugar kinase [Saccharopolyspora phatthalungensis]MBB5155574.1 2-dehydro-3-deoxygluconokinase [Saccharopolyspora phatthalungensis]
MAEPSGGAEVLCLGETMSLVAPAAPVSLEQAPAFTLSAGGAESNVAIHLASLGHRVGWASRVGADPLGRRMVASIAAAGVDTGLVEICSDAPTGVYFKDPAPHGTEVYYYRAGSAASTMDEKFLSDEQLDAPRLLHISGITPALSATCDRLVRRLLSRDRRSLITFDVNYRPALWPVEQAGPRLRELAQLADIVFVGLDEATTLWGVETPDEVRKLLDGPGVVVVKDGADAAYALSTGTVVVSAPKVDVVEPVGAGDAFAAGYLSGLLRGEDGVRCLRLGHILAAHSLLSTEDHMPLPDRAALAEWLGYDEKHWRNLSFGGSE